MAEAHVTNPPGTLRPAFPSLLPPNAITPFDHHQMQTVLASRTTINIQFQLPVSSLCKGEVTLPLSPPPPPTSPSRVKGADLHSYQAFKRFHGKTTLCSILASLTRAGVGAAHLQTPAGLNGDSCMQRACLQPAWCNGR